MTLIHSWPTATTRPRVIKLTARSWAVVLPGGRLHIHPTHIRALTAALAWATTKETRT